MSEPSEMEIDSHSEWEYEYDPTETEDYYVVLDIPKTDERFQQAQQLQPYTRDIFASYNTAPPKPQTTTVRRRRQRNKETGLLEDAPNTPDKPSDAPPVEDATAGAVADQSITPANNGVNKDSKQLRILDLHSPNPIVSYEGQLYSCRWTSAIGTDMIFTPKRNDMTDVDGADSAKPPLRSLQAWDLRAFGSARLLATPAHVQKRPSAEATAPPSEATTAAATSVAFVEETLAASRAEPSVSDASPAQAQRSDFLKRFNELKLKKKAQGLPVSATSQATTPQPDVSADTGHTSNGTSG